MPSTPGSTDRTSRSFFGKLSALVARLPYPSTTVQRVLGVLAVVSQAGIGVTGAVVRVTGSGLGCPTWPQCFSGSMVPVQHPEYDTLNQWIEFGNRLLSASVGIVAALCVIAAWRISIARPSRTRLLKLAWVMPLGVVAQAVVGGMTVLAGLLWWTVALHFLASTPLVWAAVMLLRAFTEGDESPRWEIGTTDRKLLGGVVVLLYGMLIAGTIVTGAGPHGGDPETPRLQAPVETLTQVHAALLIAFLLALTVFGMRLLRVGASTRLWRRYAVLWGVTLAQGTLGTAQAALGVPEALVAFHVLGSALVIIATASMWCAARERGHTPGIDGPPGKSTGQDDPTLSTVS